MNDSFDFESNGLNLVRRRFPIRLHLHYISINNPKKIVNLNEFQKSNFKTQKKIL
jgi:hypothetical protein